MAITSTNPDTGERFVFDEQSQQWKPLPPLPSNAPGMASGVAQAGLQGLTFGFGDELQAGAGALTAKALGAQAPLSEIYRTRKGRLGQERQAFAEENPGIALMAELGGSVVPGIISAPAVARTALMQARPLLSSGLLGMFSGGLYGAGQAETMGDVPRETGKGGALGLLGGSLAQPASNLLGRGVNVVRNAVNTARSGGVTGRTLAARAARQALARDQMTPAQVTARMQQMGPDARLVDAAGPNMVALGQGAVTPPGSAKAIGEAFLKGRKKQQFERLMGSVRRELGADGRFLQPFRSLIKQRADEAGPLYDKAFTQNIEVTEDLARLLNRPTVKKAWDLARRKAGDEGEKLVIRKAISAGRRALPEFNVGDQIPIKNLHYLQRAIRQKQRGFLVKEGAADDARIMQGILTGDKNSKGLLNILDQSDDYGKARRLYSSASDVKDAMELGKKALREDVENIPDMLAQMSATERDGYVIGAAKAIRDKMGATTEGGNVAKIAKTPLMQERLRPLFADDESFGRFMRDVATEDKFNEVTSKLLYNSQTAQRQAASRSLADSASDVAEGAAHGGAAGALVGAYRQIKGLLGRAIEVPDSVSENLAKALFEMGPDEAGRTLTKLGIPPKEAEPMLALLGSAVAVPAGAFGAIVWPD